MRHVSKYSGNESDLMDQTVLPATTPCPSTLLRGGFRDRPLDEHCLAWLVAYFRGARFRGALLP